MRDVAISGLTADNNSPTDLGSATNFSAAVGQGSNVVYAWDFGDGFQGSGRTTAHAFAFANSFTVTLTVTDSGGRVGTVSKVVDVQ